MEPEFDLDDEVAGNAADEIIESAPPPNEDAIAAMNTREEEPPTGEEKPITFGSDKDSSGEAWDANKHTATKAKTSKGLWKKRRGSAKQSATSSVSLPQANAAETRQAIEAKARMAGAAASGSIFLLGSALGGPEWQPRQQPIDEKAMMDQAWGDYFVAKGVTDFPPGVALCMALVMYAAPRFTMPETQARTRGLKAWIALRIAKRKLKKELKKRGINAEVYIDNGKLFLNGEVYSGARANRGNVGERQDDTRKEDPRSAV